MPIATAGRQAIAGKSISSLSITRPITQAGAGGGGGQSLPVNTLAPAITGQPYIGETLTATPGTWTGADSVSGEWYVDGVATGDTDTSYTVLLADVGLDIEYIETATNGSGSANQASNAISVLSLDAHIAHMFENGEQGVWYDPSDLSTMFKDAAGTIPVTALEQSVGRILDKSGRGNHATQPTTASKPQLSARVNMLTYSEDFTAAAWGKTAVTVVANSATASDGSVTADKLVPTATKAIHQIYANATGVTVAAGQRWTGSVDIKADGYGFCYVEVHGGTAEGFCLNLATGTITNASPGLIAGTVEDLGGGWWRANVTGDTIAAFVYLQLYPRATAGGPEAWLGDGVNGVLMSRAQLTQSAAATPYQRVNTATDYDTVGFPRYLKFDGVDDVLTMYAATAPGTCTVVRSVPGVGAEITTGVSVGTSHNLTQRFHGLLIVNRALTPLETANVTNWANDLAGVTP